MLVYKSPPTAGEVEEVVLNLQGFLLEAILPPVRQCQLPRNHNRLIDMKQAVTLTGLGSQHFHTAVRGVSAIYQAFKMHLSARGCQLRTWAPGCDAGQSLTLTFSNRILMSARDAEGETKQDLGRFVDPFNILRPLLRTEVHTMENHVDYWKRTSDKTAQETIVRFEPFKPEMFNLSNMVEVQVSFQVVRVGRHDYVFVPKLRAMCLLNREAELVTKAPVVPRKTIKRKVGYGNGVEDGQEEGQVPERAMKRLCLVDADGDASHADDSRGN
ncbi:hypothetical protein C8Q76DRAFT_612543 [Earliella scabrosa]|nr:hypothetical protein C8Q76DRAFT_612543 [Earliella scabrosa]